ncbi:glycosyltransferase, partial [candidate division KSB1 bacterium]|nr:glycosyltransferase [candidate division KSB1 bacterium]
MIFFLIILVGLYCGFILFLLTGTILGRKIRHAGWQPHISIIVAARNEGETIDACLNSLINLSYPKNKIEIIIMNDHSDDQSGKIIEKYAQKYNHIQHYFLDKEEKALPGKAGAVQAGIEKSKGEIIFLTDADCRVSPTWVQTLLNKFSSSVGLVGGFTLLHEKGQAASFWQKTQALDWL